MELDKKIIDKIRRVPHERPDWHEYFMSVAYLAATRSSCFQLHTGAVIVKDKRIISTGYNGAPSKIKNSLEHGFCNKEAHGVNFDTKGTSTCRGEHGERNAMSEVSRKDLSDTTLYTVYFPCTPCAKTICGNGISKVVYSKVYKDEKEAMAEKYFKEAKIEVVQMYLDFDKIYKMVKNII